MPIDEIDTDNRFMVSASGGNIVMLRPPRGSMSKSDALNLAAWLVVLADDEPPHKFLSLVEAVQNA